MADSITITVDDAQVAAALRRLQDKADDLSDPLGRVGEQVVGDAQGYAPKRSGALASNIHLVRRRRAASIASSLAYSGVQNYGWARHGITGRYFLNRAADTKGDLAADLIAAEITKDIRTVGL